MDTQHGDIEQAGKPNSPDEKATASKAAELLGYSGRTARAVAKRRHEAGDTTVEKAGTNWWAPLSWWEKWLGTPDEYAHSHGRARGQR